MSTAGSGEALATPQIEVQSEKARQRTSWTFMADNLLRLHAATADEKYLKQALTLAKSNTYWLLRNKYATDALCYGRAGVVLTLLQLHSVSQEPWILMQINLYIRKMLNTLKVENDKLKCTDPGVHHILLRLASYFKNNTFSFIEEHLRNADYDGKTERPFDDLLSGNAERMDRYLYPFISISQTEFRKWMIQKSFPRIFYMAENLCADSLMIYLNSITALPSADDFLSFATRLVSGYEGPFAQELSSLYNLEKTRFEMSRSVEDPIRLSMHDLKAAEETAACLAIPEERLNKKWIRINPDIVQLETNCNPVIDYSLEPEDNFSADKQPHITCLRVAARNVKIARWLPTTIDVFHIPDMNNVMEWPLSKTRQLLVSLIKEPAQLGTVAAQLTSKLAESKEEADKVDPYELIRTFLLNGILQFCTEQQL